MSYKSVLTEGELRGKCMPLNTQEYCVKPNVYVTQGVKDYLKEKKIVLKYEDTAQGTSVDTTWKMEHSKMEHSKKEQPYKAMKVEPFHLENGYKYIDYETGQGYKEKPENMTHLRGNKLIKKSSSGIKFRGYIDYFKGQILHVQFIAEKNGYDGVVVMLEDVSLLVDKILSAEVKDITMEPWELCGMEPEKLRRISHNIKDFYGIEHPIPHYKMGETTILLNSLRTIARRCELYAVEALEDRQDIILALNRMSSCIYIIFCEVIAKKVR